MFEILILSFIQGITEFLPISSSGHLIVLPHVFQWDQHSLELDVALHAGTLCAVVLYFFQDIRNMTVGFLRFLFSARTRHDPFIKNNARLAFSIIVATLPTVMIGFALKKYDLVDSFRNPYFIAMNGIIWALIMFVADSWGKKTRGISDLTLVHSFMIGVAQSFAFLPGSSRSGTCMSMARALGFDRVAATRYAFLLSIPAVLGAIVLVFGEAFYNGLQTPVQTLVMAMLLSFIFGIIAIHYMLKYVTRHTFTLFILYRLVLGGLILYLF